MEERFELLVSNVQRLELDFKYLVYTLMLAAICIAIYLMP